MPGTLPPELADVADFLGASPPFNELARADLEATAAELEISYHPQGQAFDRTSLPEGLRILRSGAVDIRDDEGTLLDRLGEGESFHIDGLNAEQGGVTASVIEDALVYLLPDAEYRRLRNEHRSVDRYFSGQRSRRLRRAARYEPQPHSMMREVHTVMARDLLTVSPMETVQVVAAVMTERRVSSAFVVENAELLGIVTDRDIRARYAAAGLDPHVGHESTEIHERAEVLLPAYILSAGSLDVVPRGIRGAPL